MSADTRHQQWWLFAVVVILVNLLSLVVIGLIRSIPQKDDDPHPRIGHRSPAVGLNYCSPEDTKLCIVSFGQIEGGDMLVNFQLPTVIYPPFTLVIDRYGVESTYECNRTKGFLQGMTCSGDSQIPGEPLLFKVIAKKDGRLVAEGKFAIIGIAISTPQELSTATGTATETPIATATEDFGGGLKPLPTQGFPTSDFSTPGPPTSYPNPSYP